MASKAKAETEEEERLTFPLKGHSVKLICQKINFLFQYLLMGKAEMSLNTFPLAFASFAEGKQSENFPPSSLGISINFRVRFWVRFFLWFQGNLQKGSFIE